MDKTSAPKPARSLAQRHVARSLWYVGEGKAELRHEPLPALSPGHARVRTLYSGLSRGTERLVLAGAVPPSEYERMRAPLQAGAFPYPVKYGYCASGIVEQGAAELLGRVVFCLHPHQDLFHAPEAMLIPVPDGIPAKRATLAANMETALNAVWDAGAAPGDRIVIVGAGIVGLMVAAVCTRLPGADVTVADVAPERRTIVEALGARFALLGGGPLATTTPDFNPNGHDADVVFHTSANPAGLAVALSCAGTEATVVEMSWYGNKPVDVPLGGAFHSRRLRLISSQVGLVSAGHRPRWDYRRRLTKALAMLAAPASKQPPGAATDPTSDRASALDQLVAEEIPFADAATAVPAALNGPATGLAPVLRY
ncbi:MAG: zinc-binding alcohol dehydrogenase [Hyphomicrobiaceae bacterium]|nr:zinc-binding alcohol dehydrogenase [Hyphomicrobiaceae bacterium]